MRRDNEEIKNLAFTIQYWLSYVDTVSRANILQESSLRYAISEIIERRLNGTCILEKTHPKFSTRDIDIIWVEPSCDENLVENFRKRGKEIQPNVRLADKISEIYNYSNIIECKLAPKSMSPSELQEIVDDVCRLYFFKKKYTKRRAYLIWTGISECFSEKIRNNVFDIRIIKEDKKKKKNVPDLEEHINDQAGNRKNQIQEVLSLQKSSEKGRLENKEVPNADEPINVPKLILSDHQISIDLDYDKDDAYRIFYKKYNKVDGRRKKNNIQPLNDEEKCIAFVTKPIAINYPPKDHGTSHGVAIWEILLTKNRKNNINLKK